MTSAKMSTRTPGLDVDRLLDNAATCSQHPELLQDDDGEDRVIRECVRLNVVNPMLKAYDADRALIAELTACLKLAIPIVGGACSDPTITDKTREVRSAVYSRLALAESRAEKEGA